MRQPPLPTALLVTARHQAGLVSARQCDAKGVNASRRHRLVAAGRCSSPTRGVLDLSAAVAELGIAEADGPDLRRRRAAFLALLAHGPQAVAVGQCALALLGVQGLPLHIRPEVAMPGGTPRATRDGIVVRCFAQRIRVVQLHGFRVAAPVHALAQAMPELDRDHAIAVLDSAVRTRLVDGEDLPEVARLVRGRRGAARTRAWWRLVDGRAESPLETRARLQCSDAGVPPDELQVPVRDVTGRIVARGDLGWRLRNGRWLLAEIDGAGPHATPQALFEDRRRQNAIVGTGRVDVLRFTAADIASGRLLPAAVRAHLAHDELRSLPRAAI